MGITSVRLTRLLPLFLVAAGFLAYLNTLGNELVFDDTYAIHHDPAIRNTGDLTATLTGWGRTLVRFTLALNYRFDGEEPRGYHLVNMLVHIAAGLVLYGLARRILQSRSTSESARPTPWLPFTIALLWLVHPLNTQAVTYVIQRYESMMGLFYLLTLYGVARCATPSRAASEASLGEQSGKGAARYLWAIVAILALAAALASKEVAVTAPFVAVLLDRTFFARSFSEVFRARWWLHGPLFALVALFLVVTLTPEDNALTSADSSAGFGLRAFKWYDYLLTQGEVILHYLRLAFVPWPLVIDYRWIPATFYPTLGGKIVHVVVPVAIVSLLLLASLFGTIRNTWWGFLGLAFFAILSITSSVIPIADLAVEHRMYLPLACVIALVVIGARHLIHRFIPPPQQTLVSTLCVSIIACGLAALTIARNREYATGVTLWTTVTERAPWNSRGFHNLGQALQQDGRGPEAMRAYYAAIERFPDFDDSHHNLGQLWIEAGDPVRARDHLQRAVELDPEDANSRYEYARALFYADDAEASLAQLDEALRLKPDAPKALNLRGIVRANLGDVEGGIADLRRAGELDPADAEPYYNLALTLRKLGRYAEAEAAFDEALRRKPDDPRTLREWARMLATAPDDSARDGARAVQMAQAASILQNNRDIATLEVLAAARAELGQWDQAISTIRHLITTAQERRLPPQAIAELESRLRLYENQQPYREAPAQ